jgi:flagellar hook-length control protein FliK
VTTTVAPKTGPLHKASGAAQEPGVVSTDAKSAPDTADASATAISTATPTTSAAQPPVVTGKPNAAHGAVDAIKADGTPNSPATSPANIAAHAHAAAEAGHVLANSSETAAQAAGTFQPQLHATAATAAAAPSLTVTAATNEAVPLSGLALEIAVTAKSGKSRFEIRLDPAELGRIDVRIDVDRNGHVTSHLMVEKPETLSMLRQDAPQLQRALDDAGFNTGNSGLQFSLRDQSSSNQNDNSGAGNNARRLVIGEEDTTPAVVAGRSYGRMLGSSSGVDIRV